MILRNVEANEMRKPSMRLLLNRVSVLAIAYVC